MMATEDMVMVIDKPHLVVKLHKKLLEVDFKKGVRKELEDVLESRPILRKSLGFLFQTVIPLDVPIKSIESVHVDKKGQVKIVIPSRKDVIIPLTPRESKSFVAKLNQLIAIEKKAAAPDVVMVIKKPHFTVKLHKALLEVDLKEGMRKELEDVLEAKPILRESLGFLFQTAIPLDVPLKDIESVNVDKKGLVKIATPLRKDIVIPLKPTESQRLVEKMNELISIEKERVIRELQESEKAKRAFEPKYAEAAAEARREVMGRV